MNFSKVFSTAAIIISLTASSAFASAGIKAHDYLVENSSKEESGRCDKKDFRQKHEEFQKDPIKALESGKEKVQTLLKEGKISKEKADEITSKIDSKINEIKNFNKLDLKQKKDKLINDCKSHIEKRVKEGKLDKDKADALLKDYTEKINNWDGKGYPQYPRCKCN